MRPAAVTGYWDYGFYNEVAECMNVVQVDVDGAGVVPCATTAGDQLRHLGCPLSGPCDFAGERK